MIYGYARCSTNETKQDISRQVKELQSAGAEEIFLEYEHGDAVIKKQLELLFDTAQPGDTIITAEVFRLARSTRQLCDIIDLIKEKQLKLEILGSIKIDCSEGNLDPMTKAFLQLTGVFGELELSIIRARVKSGVQHARDKGKRIGRPVTTDEDIPAVFYRHYPEYKNGKLNKSELARVCNLSRTSIYKYINMVEKSKTAD